MEIDWKALKVGDTYTENDITFKVTEITNNNGQLFISAQPVTLSE